MIQLPAFPVVHDSLCDLLLGEVLPRVSPTYIFTRYNVFRSENFEVLQKKGFTSEDIKEMPFEERRWDMERWIKKEDRAIPQKKN